MAILGTDVILQFYQGGTYEPFICATECSVEINTELKDVRTVNGGKWEEKRGKKNGYRVSLSGLIVLGEPRPTTFWLVDIQTQWLEIPFRMVFTDPETMLVKIVSGNALIEKSQITSSATSFANSSFDFAGNGLLSITDSATTCNATIGNITYGPTETPGQILIGYEDVTNAARLEYSIDGGPREVIFSPGSNGAFAVSGLSEGPHTIQIWVVCESGVDGEENEFVFEIDGEGEPAPSCEVPGMPELIEWAANVGTIEWAASPSSPANGYYWELGFVATENISQTATTSDLSATLTLIEGINYFFRIKSLCQEGVSESPFVEFTFTPAAAPSCNVPGSPVMSDISDSGATATWTAPIPAPADGYGWRLYQGLTLVDSGTTTGLSVILSGLIADSSYTFQVRSICSTGVNESGYNSVGFNTLAATNDISWTFNEDLGNGTLVIKVDGLEVVNETAAGIGAFTATSGQNVQVRLTCSTGQVIVTDTTAAVEIANETDSGLVVAVFTTTADHSYNIQATVTS